MPNYCVDPVGFWQDFFCLLYPWQPAIASLVAIGAAIYTFRGVRWRAEFDKNNELRQHQERMRSTLHNAYKRLDIVYTQSFTSLNTFYHMWQNAKKETSFLSDGDASNVCIGLMAIAESTHADIKRIIDTIADIPAYSVHDIFLLIEKFEINVLRYGGYESILIKERRSFPVVTVERVDELFEGDGWKTGKRCLENGQLICRCAALFLANKAFTTQIDRFFPVEFHERNGIIRCFVKVVRHFICGSHNKKQEFFLDYLMKFVEKDIPQTSGDLQNAVKWLRGGG